jgi:hypothetical protein
MPHIFGYKLEIPTIVYLSVLSQMEMKSVCTFLPAQINHVELTTMVFNYETPIVRFHPNLIDTSTIYILHSFCMLRKNIYVHKKSRFDCRWLHFLAQILRTENATILKRHSHSTSLVDFYITLPYGLTKE